MQFTPYGQFPIFSEFPQTPPAPGAGMAFFRLVLRGRRLGRELQHAAEDTQDPARGATRLGPALDQDQVLSFNAGGLTMAISHRIHVWYIC